MYGRCLLINEIHANWIIIIIIITIIRMNWLLSASRS